MLKICGDVHGKLDKYVDLVKGAEYSLQVGDMAFNYDYLTKYLDPSKHKCIGGNHDNYSTEKCPICKGLDSDNCQKCETRGYIFSQLSDHFLKDYGVWHVPGFGPIFYVRGAWSIDKTWRVPGISWWHDEELTYQQCDNAIRMYQEVKPEFVVSHTLPRCIIPRLPPKRLLFGGQIFENRTEAMLETMYENHQPKHWIFGHWHIDWEETVVHPKTKKSTKFSCLSELAYIDFPLDNAVNLSNL